MASQVGQDTVFVEVVEPVGSIPFASLQGGFTLVGVGDDGGGGQGAGVDGAAARPAKRSEDGIAHRVIGVGVGLAGGACREHRRTVVGTGQAVEFVPFASLQRGCALIGIGDDAGGGGVGLADDADGGHLRISPAQAVDGQGHGIGAKLGVGVGVCER